VGVVVVVVSELVASVCKSLHLNARVQRSSLRE